MQQQSAVSPRPASISSDQKKPLTCVNGSICPMRLDGIEGITSRHHRSMLAAMSVTTTLVLATWVAQIIVKVARRPILLLAVTLAFVTSAILSLALSGIVFHGWWQDFFLELGVGLLIAGVVDVAILGALHGLIEGTVPTPRLMPRLPVTEEPT